MNATSTLLHTRAQVAVLTLLVLAAFGGWPFTNTPSPCASLSRAAWSVGLLPREFGGAVGITWLLYSHCQRQRCPNVGPSLRCYCCWNCVTRWKLHLVALGTQVRELSSSRNCACITLLAIPSCYLALHGKRTEWGAIMPPAAQGRDGS